MKQSLEKNGMHICVKVASITPTHVILHLNDDEYLMPYTRVPWFRTAKVEDIFDVRMNGFDEIRWDKLDIDLDVDSLKYPEKYPLIMRQYLAKDEQIVAAEPEIQYHTTS